MKYEVIGWINSGNGRYKAHTPLTVSVENAIIKNIRANGYYFGGQFHDDYCPVLNDGTYALYSTRGWGSVMARAHNMDNSEYSYMSFYMDESIDPKLKKTPDDYYPCDLAIVPKESLVEVFEMHLSDDMFEAVKAGTKTIETRLFDEKRQQIDVGDYVEFVKESDSNQRVKRKIIDLDVDRTFQERFTKIKFEGKDCCSTLRYDPKELGFDENANLDEILDGMHKYYDEEQEAKYGVVTFKLGKPMHTCRTLVSVWTDAMTNRNIAEYNERAYTKGEDSKRVDDFEDDFYIFEQKEQDIIELLGTEDPSEVEVFSRRVVEIGQNEEYDPDVNVMIRKTLRRLFGKEAWLKEIKDKYWMCMTLDIVVLAIKDIEEPRPKLELDDDIKEFLQKSGVEVDIKVYEI